MQTTNNNFNISYGGAKDITLKYVLEKRKHLLPSTMVRKISETINSEQFPPPTLRALHQDTYAPLLDCKTLDEARQMFPEFQGMKEVSKESLPKGSKNTRIIAGRMPLADFPLFLVQESWAKLRNLDDIAQGLGLKGRSQLAWLQNQIGFVNRDKNYTALLNASDPELNAVIGAKTRAFNQAHPEIMYARNRHAAQGCKKDECRTAASERMKKLAQTKPSYMTNFGIMAKEVWDRIPDVKKAMNKFIDDQITPFQKGLLKQQVNNPRSLTLEQKKYLGKIRGEFWRTHLEALEKFRETWRIVSAEHRVKK